jgi:hypothetical protein
MSESASRRAVGAGHRPRLPAGLLGYWADGFDWRAQERWLNGFRHFRAGIDGIGVHFVHERARSGRGIPLILTIWLAELLRRVPAATAAADRSGRAWH